MALIRYPGSKDKLAADIVEMFPDEFRFALWSNANPLEYREPFFGCGAVGFRILEVLHHSCSVWLNDADPWLANLWTSVKDHPKELCRRIDTFTPTADAFYEFKAQDGSPDVEPLEAGFRKLALHQMSVSGFGAKSGGPLGGRDQANAKYPVDCRWNPNCLMDDVARLNKRLRGFANLRITCGDFAPLLSGAGEDCFIYMDPPYVGKGPQLYKYAMDEAAHRRLADCVANLRCPWVLSYDDHPLVRELYKGFSFRELEVIYTNAVNKTGKRPKNREVVIFPESQAA